MSPHDRFSDVGAGRHDSYGDLNARPEAAEAHTGFEPVPPP